MEPRERALGIGRRAAMSRFQAMIRLLARSLSVGLPVRAAAALRLLALIPITLSAAEEHASPNRHGEVAGRVTFHGDSPKSAVADDAGIHRDLLTVHKETRGLANVVAWLEPRSVPRPPDHLPGSLDPAVMDQRDHEFAPRLLAVRSGQAVRFSNSDPANHNVRTSSPQPTNEFNVFTPMGGSYLRRFVSDPQQQAVRVECDIHPWMRAWIYVFDHPWFDVADERGRFEIRSVPEGEYILNVRQPDIGYHHEQTIRISNSAVALVEINIRSNTLSLEKEEP
jgi:plastocyanin